MVLRPWLQMTMKTSRMDLFLLFHYTVMGSIQLAIAGLIMIRVQITSLYYKLSRTKYMFRSYKLLNIRLERYE